MFKLTKALILLLLLSSSSLYCDLSNKIPTKNFTVGSKSADEVQLLTKEIAAYFLNEKFGLPAGAITSALLLHLAKTYDSNAILSISFSLGVTTLSEIITFLRKNLEDASLPVD